MNDLGTSLSLSSVHASLSSQTHFHYVVPSALPSGRPDSQKTLTRNEADGAI